MRKNKFEFKIITEKTNPDGKAYCVMFNSIISGKPLPKYLSSDNDPLFLFHRWKANLRILDIEEIKSIAGVPQSHPFIERTIKSIRTEFLEMNTPSQMASNENANKKAAQLESYRWKTHCNGLYQYPVAA